MQISLLELFSLCYIIFVKPSPLRVFFGMTGADFSVKDRQEAAHYMEMQQKNKDGVVISGIWGLAAFQMDNHYLNRQGEVTDSWETFKT